MVPKIIHYCWFGGAEKSPLIQQCIQTWYKVMPDYELKEWNESNFDLDSVPFVREAYKSGKWAFVADYVRLYAMYNYGGIYMDTDVKVLRRFDEFLNYSFFTCQESHPDLMVEGYIRPDGTRNPEIKYVKAIGLCSAVMGAEKGCKYLEDCLSHYNTIHFDAEHREDFVIVNIIAVLLEKYGYRYILDRDQHLEGNMIIMKPHIFAGMSTLSKESYALHLYNGSWVEDKANLRHILRNRFPSIYSFVQQFYYRLTRKEHRRPITNRLLIVSTHLSHPTDAGNRAAIMAQVNIYKQLGYEVHYLFANTSLRHNMDYEEMRNYWGKNYHQFDMLTAIRCYRYVMDFVREKLCNGYWKVDDHYPIGITRHINRLDKQLNFDVIVVQYIRLSKILPSVSIPRKAIFTHDVFAYKDLRTQGPFYETCTAHEEAKALQRCPNIFAIQEQEAVYFNYVSPNSKIYTVYNSYQYHAQPIVNSKNVLFISSTMKFNIEAIEKFVTEIWPKVLERVPSAELLIAGGICSAVNYSSRQHVKMLGHVDCVEKFYEQGNVVINPVFNGTGLKIKTFEALSFGKTTIVHPHSLTGIFEKSQAPLITAETTPEWVEKLVEVLADGYNYSNQQKQAEKYIMRMNEYILSQYQNFLFQ